MVHFGFFSKHIKQLFAALTVIICMLAGSCGSLSGLPDTQTPGETQSQSPPPSPTPGIPDARDTGVDTSHINPYVNICEYGDKAYLIIYSNFILYDKKQKTASLLLPDCREFACNNGVLYLFCWDAKSSYIKSCDVATGEMNTVYTSQNASGYLSFYGGRIYFLCSYAAHASDMRICSIDPDGKDFQETRLAYNAGLYYLYQNNYYYSLGGGYSLPIYKDDGSGSCVELAQNSSKGFFEIKDNKLYYNEDYHSLKCADIISGDTVKIDDTCSEKFTLLGQYIVYPAWRDYKLYLAAYDTETGEKYDLVDITDHKYNIDMDSYYMVAAGGKAYIFWLNNYGSCSVDSIVIKGGKAKLENVLIIKDIKNIK